MRKHAPWSGYLMAALGIGGLTTEAGLHIYGYFTRNPYQLNTWVLVILMVIGFTGFYLINPQGTDEGSGILTKRVVAIISVLRGSKGEVSVSVEPTKPNTEGAAVQVIPPTPDKGEAG